MFTDWSLGGWRDRGRAVEERADRDPCLLDVLDRAFRIGRF